MRIIASLVAANLAQIAIAASIPENPIRSSSDISPTYPVTATINAMLTEIDTIDTESVQVEGSQKDVTEPPKVRQAQIAETLVSYFSAVLRSYVSETHFHSASFASEADKLSKPLADIQAKFAQAIPGNSPLWGKLRACQQLFHAMESAAELLQVYKSEGVANELVRKLVQLNVALLAVEVPDHADQTEVSRFRVKLEKFKHQFVYWQAVFNAANEVSFFDRFAFDAQVAEAEQTFEALTKRD